MTQHLKKLWSEQEGQSLPEFVLLLFLVCLTAVSAMGGVAIKVDSMYCNVSTHVSVAGSPALTGGTTVYSVEGPSEIQIQSKDETQQKPTD